MNTAEILSRKGSARSKKRQPADPDLLTFGKVPPHNKWAEEAVLGAMLLEPHTVAEVMQFLRPSMFYSDFHGRIFQAIQSLSQNGPQGVDVIQVVEELRKIDALDSTEIYAVTKLTMNVSNAANILQHVGIILSNWERREAIRLGGELLQQGYDDGADPREIFTNLSTEVLRIQDSGNASSDGEISSTAVQMLRTMEAGEPGKLLGQDTGLQLLNKQISGLCQPDLIIIAARPGQGKSALMGQVAYNLSVLQGVPGDIFSLEMSQEQLLLRMWACDAGIPMERIKKCMLTLEDKQLLFKSMGKIANSPLRIDDKANLNIQTLRAKAHMAKRKRDIKYIMVDYLQLMGATDNRMPREQQISEISRGLKMLAKELQIPIVALSQLSRECEKRPDKMPQLSDLRESGAIEQDADIVIFLMRPEYYGFTVPMDLGGEEYAVNNLMVVKIAKNRHNAPGLFPLQCELGLSRIYDYGFSY